MLKMDPKYAPDDIEYREVFGVGFRQKRNDCEINEAVLSPDKIVTKEKELSLAAKRDLILGNISIKYTQSNSVGFAKNGQMIGIGAGQQSRVDCVKLAGKKARSFLLRQHPKVLSLDSVFRKSVKKQDRVNARIKFIEKSLTNEELDSLFEKPIEYLTDLEVTDFLRTQNQISLVSDAFFPFRDNIDVCHQLGFVTNYVAQTGGSINDKGVIDACDEHGMVMALTGQRLFHH